MGTGYTRNDTSNNIADGNIINAADLDGEFDAIESAMGTGGHTHDGTSAEGGPVTVLGPVQDFVASATEIKPKTTNTLSIGTNSLLFKDMFLDGVATVGSIKIDNAGTIGSASDADAIAISSGGVVTFSQAVSNLGNVTGKTSSGFVLALQTSDTTIEATNVLGKIEFSAPDEASGTDAILVGASIEALAEGTFSSSVNSTALVFKTNTTGAATERMRLTSAGDLHFLDSRKAIFGAGSDLQIYHNGSHSYIQDVGTGRLYITTNGDEIRLTPQSGGENGLRVQQDGAVNLYYDNAEKFSTTTTGIDVTGTVTADGINSSGNFAFTAADGMQISARESISINIDSDDNDSSRAFTVISGSSGSTESLIVASEDAGVSLYYDNAAKLATTSTGVDITGTLVSDGLTVDGITTLGTGAWPTSSVGKSGGRVAIVSSTENQYLLIANTNGTVAADNGSTIYLGATGTTNTANLAAAQIFGGKSNATSGNFESYLSFKTSASNGTTTERMRIDSSGNVGIGLSSPTKPLSVFAGDGNGNIVLTRTGTSETFTLSTYFATASGNQFSLLTNTAHPLVFLTNSAEAMRIDSSGNVGIGTDSPQARFQVSQAANLSLTNSDAQMRIEGNGYTGFFGLDGTSFQIGQNSSLRSMTFHSGSGMPERMRIDSSGNVGIGTDSPSTKLEIDQGSSSTASFKITGSSSPGMRIVESSGVTAHFANDSAAVYIGSSTNHPFVLRTNNTERMRIDTSGNLLVGTTNADVGGSTTGIRLSQNGSLYSSTDETDAIGNGPLYGDRRGTNNVGDILTLGLGGFVKASIGVLGTNSSSDNGGITFNTISANVTKTERMRINSSGNVGIGTASPQGVLDLGGASTGRSLTFAKYNNIFGSYSEGSLNLTSNYYGDTSSNAYKTSTTANFGAAGIEISGTGGTSTSGLIQFFVDAAASKTADAAFVPTERMRIDSSGNLLVGKTSSSFSTAGIELQSDAELVVTRNGSTASFNRLSDGNIIDFYESGSHVGSISSRLGTHIQIQSAGDTSGLHFGGAEINPVKNQAISDNTIDLGQASYRFDDIYATNGTIQTSDRNEKQDIAELSDAEQRVAVAAKGLLRKFRWKDAVAEKGDEARTHFGIIAQDLQAAFAAEGLDAGDYAMFISSTWTDEETGEERTRMGVRYSELLAFIIAAI